MRRSVLFAVRGASERRENAAGGLCQHPAKYYGEKAGIDLIAKIKSEVEKADPLLLRGRDNRNTPSVWSSAAALTSIWQTRL
jgi:hypothetical protein